MLLDENLEAARKEGKNVVILAVDVNDLKCVNDRFGYAVGDRALRMVARELLGCVRDSDSISRFGDDEFFVVITGATRPAIDQIAKRVQKRIQQNAIRTHNGQCVKVSVSVGIKWVAADHSDRLTGLGNSGTLFDRLQHTR